MTAMGAADGFGSLGSGRPTWTGLGFRAWDLGFRGLGFGV